MQNKSHPFCPQSEKEEAIFRERARKLAQKEETAREKLTLELVEFELSGEHYGLESRYIKEVAPLGELTLLPGTPPFVAGLVSLRGKILSVVDLCPILELPKAPMGQESKLLHLLWGEMEFALLSHKILGRREIDQKQLQTSLPTLQGLPKRYLKGVTTEHLVVLDGGQILTDPDLIVKM